MLGMSLLKREVLLLTLVEMAGKHGGESIYRVSQKNMDLF